MQLASDVVVRPTRRYAYIDQLRALAALYVALFHALLVLWPEGAESPPWYLAWVDYGHFGVAIFIVLSGYSLALRPARRGDETAGRYWPFMKRRAWRLLPPYWVVLAGSAVLLKLEASSHVVDPTGAAAGEVWASKGSVPLSSIVSHALLLQDVWHVPSINSPLWSIAVEWHLYFLFPALIFLGCRYGMAKLLVGTTVIGIAAHYLVVGTGAAGTTPQFLALFSAGIAAAFATERSDRRRIPRRRGWALVGLSFVLFLAIAPHAEVLADFVSGGVFAVALVALAMDDDRADEHPAPARRSMARLAWIGTFSYSLYLVHSPTEKIVFHYAVKPLGLTDPVAFAVLSIVGIGIALIAAYGLHVVVERPAMARSQRVALD